MAEPSHRQSRWTRIYAGFSHSSAVNPSGKSTSEPDREKLVTKLLRACPLTLGIPSVIKTIEEERAKRKAAAGLKPPKTKSSWTSRITTARATRANTRRTSPVGTARPTRVNTRSTTPVGTATTTRVNSRRTSPVHTRRTSQVSARRISPVNTTRTSRESARRRSPVTTTRPSRANTVETTRANTRRSSPVDTARALQERISQTAEETPRRNSPITTSRTSEEATDTRPISPLGATSSARATSRRESAFDSSRVSWANVTRATRSNTTRNSRANTRRPSPIATGNNTPTTTAQTTRTNTRQSSPAALRRPTLETVVSPTEAARAGWANLRTTSRAGTTRNSRRNSRRSSPVDSRRTSARNSRRNTRRRNSPVDPSPRSIAFEVSDPEDIASAASARVSTVTIVRMSARVDRLFPNPAGSRSNSRSPSRPTSVMSGPVSGTIHRPSFAEHVRTGSNHSNASTASVNSPGLGYDFEKPLASGNGVSLSINLAEPVLFLQGFDQSELANQNTTMLRGSFHLRVSKTAKIKTVTLRFNGRAETEWPEGIPPKKSEFKDKENFLNHTWTFFNAQFPTAELGTGADCVKSLKGPSTTTTDLGITDSSTDLHRTSIGNAMTAKDVKRLSLKENQSSSFSKGEQGAVAQKGYRTFTPGDYIYNFEHPIDSRNPETINVELGSVRYELEATVERAGAFRSNLVGTKEVTLIRAPAEGSLEQVEPIAISRNWEDQLHYDIVISGKSFPLGAQVPIAFKLTPLAKVQCHRVKVFVTENIQYYTVSKRVHRLEPTRKIQLFEKRADGPFTSAYPGSSMRITAGGGVAYDYRDAAARGDEHVPRDMTNLLGNLNDSDANIGPTEMEFNVQLPSCHSMETRDRLAKLHFDTTYAGIQVHHWIKIVMRLSKPDAEDPSKRRHFEISIDSPFHILSCRATQANIALPAYSSPESTTLLTEHSSCGCPGAPRRRNSPSSLLPTLSSLRLDTSLNNNSTSSITEPPSAGLTRPPAAHIHNDPSTAHQTSSSQGRPMHLLRQPSFNPPPFEAFEDDRPPQLADAPLQTPPPQYDTLIDGDPSGGLADYFSRLADEVGEDEDARGTLTPSSRMEMPLSPGGRLNRSMDERRTWVPLEGGMGGQ